MKKLIKIIFISVLYSSCNMNNDVENIVEKSSVKTQSDELFDKLFIMQSLMKDTVSISNLLNRITHQERIKEIVKLEEGWDEIGGRVYYSEDSVYFFKLYNQHYAQDLEDENTIFVDGNKAVNFDKHRVTCYSDTNYICEDYGFNLSSYLIDPKIIEVCSREFLYSEISYWCNGMGCGCNIFFIYDLENKKATFIENYRILYDGYFISDFNGDGNPDILTANQTYTEKMKGFEMYEIEIVLACFTYKNGVFIPSMNANFGRQNAYFLYGIMPYDQMERSGLIYSITQNQWFNNSY